MSKPNRLDQPLTDPTGKMSSFDFAKTESLFSLFCKWGKSWAEEAARTEHKQRKREAHLPQTIFRVGGFQTAVPEPDWRHGPWTEILPSPVLVEEDEQRTQFQVTRLTFRSAPTIPASRSTHRHYHWWGGAAVSPEPTGFRSPEMPLKGSRTPLPPVSPLEVSRDLS